MIQDNASDEGRPIEPNASREDAQEEKRDDGLREASLAEELEIVRKRRERIRLERERTEELLREMDLVLETSLKEMERRAEEQSSVELELYKVLLLKDLRTSSMVSVQLK